MADQSAAAAPSASSSSAPGPAAAPPARAAVAPAPGRGWGRWRLILGLLAVAAGVVVAWPHVRESFETVSTDDAYVSGHSTLVAARVPGQVVKVLADDNNRVRKGDLLVELDPAPNQVQVDIAQSALEAAQADLAAVRAQARATEAQMRGLRFALQRALEDVDNQVALLRSKAAALASQRATVAKAQADYDRAAPLVKSGSISAEDVDHRKQALSEAIANEEQALQNVYQVRSALGLPLRPETGEDLTAVPEELGQNFSSVRQAQAQLLQASAQLGVTISLTKSPKEMIAEFYKRDPEGNLDRIYEEILKDAPSVKQAEAKVLQARRNLEQAQLNLSYCRVYAEIDGVVSRRDVNPGNNVVAGQALMAVRSLTDIWVDANFKETQLASLRIGLPVDIEVDMYGGKKRFKGRVSGFASGTGSTLALLPAENATGNFVKVVQRLPVRVDLVEYNAEEAPLFIGLSVTPRVRIHEAPTGPEAGKMLQAFLATEQAGEAKR